MIRIRSPFVEHSRKLGEIFLVAAAIAIVVAVQCAPAADGSSTAPPAETAPPPLAIVNGKPIDSEFATLMTRDLASAGQPGGEDIDKAVAERLVSNELLVQEALKAGLDRIPELRARAEMLRRDVLANAYLQSYLAVHPLAAKEVRAEYERRKARLIGAKEYNLHHIMVADETVARDIIKQLAAGRDFEQLADDFSIDDGPSKSHGGGLGWVSLDTADKVLIDAAATLKPGEFSHEPVRTAFGWDVLRLDGVRGIRILPYEAVEARLRQQLQQQEATKLTQELRAKANVVWQEAAASPTPTASR